MNATPVLALVNSRLGTDVVMIRLRRAGIECRKISAVFPRRFTPNAVACWLNIAQDKNLGSDSEPISAAGPLREVFAESGNRASIADLIERAGFDRKAAAAAEHHLRFGENLLCVHAEDEAEVSIAWHVFKHSMVETIAVGGSLAETEAKVSRTDPISVPHWSAAA